MNFDMFKETYDVDMVGLKTDISFLSMLLATGIASEQFYQPSCNPRRVTTKKILYGADGHPPMMTSLLKAESLYGFDTQGDHISFVLYEMRPHDESQPEGEGALIECITMHDRQIDVPGLQQGTEGRKSVYTRLRNVRAHPMSQSAFDGLLIALGYKPTVTDEADKNEEYYNGCYNNRQRVLGFLSDMANANMFERNKLEQWISQRRLSDKIQLDPKKPLSHARLQIQRHIHENSSVRIAIGNGAHRTWPVGKVTLGMQLTDKFPCLPVLEVHNDQSLEALLNWQWLNEENKLSPLTKPCTVRVCYNPKEENSFLKYLKNVERVMDVIKSSNEINFKTTQKDHIAKAVYEVERSNYPFFDFKTLFSLNRSGTNEANKIRMEQMIALADVLEPLLENESMRSLLKSAIVSGPIKNKFDNSIERDVEKMLRTVFPSNHGFFQAIDLTAQKHSGLPPSLTPYRYTLQLILNGLVTKRAARALEGFCFGASMGHDQQSLQSAEAFNKAILDIQEPDWYGPFVAVTAQKVANTLMKKFTKSAIHYEEKRRFEGVKAAMHSVFEDPDVSQDEYEKQLRDTWAKTRAEFQWRRTGKDEDIIEGVFRKRMNLALRSALQTQILEAINEFGPDAVCMAEETFTVGHKYFTMYQHHT